MLKFTVLQLRVTLLAFIGIYAILGVASIIVSQVISRNCHASFADHNVDVELASLIATIDVSQHSMWLMYTSFWIWGIVILVYSFYGGVSIIIGNPLHLKVFAFLLLIISSMKVPIIVYTMNITDSKTMISYTTHDLWSNFKDSQSDRKAANAMKYVQDWHNCCGVYGYEDYYKIRISPSVLRCDSRIDDGCGQKVAAAYTHSYQTIAGISLLITILEVPATVLSFYLSNLIRQRLSKLKEVPQEMENSLSKTL